MLFRKVKFSAGLHFHLSAILMSQSVSINVNERIDQFPQPSQILKIRDPLKTGHPPNEKN